MEARVTEASEVQTATVARVAVALEVQTTMETSEAQTIMVTSETQVVTETSEAHKVTEARREDLREPLQMADAETGPTTKVVPTIV